MYRYLDHHHLLLSDPYHQPIQIFTVCACHVPKTSSGPAYNLHSIGTWINCWCLLFWSKVHLVHARIKSQIYHANQENSKWSYCYIWKKRATNRFPPRWRRLHEVQPGTRPLHQPQVAWCQGTQISSRVTKQKVLDLQTKEISAEKSIEASIQPPGKMDMNTYILIRNTICANLDIIYIYINIHILCKSQMCGNHDVSDYNKHF